MLHPITNMVLLHLCSSQHSSIEPFFAMGATGGFFTETFLKIHPTHILFSTYISKQFISLANTYNVALYLPKIIF
jgi:hypothetical protein